MTRRLNIMLKFFVLKLLILLQLAHVTAFANINSDLHQSLLSKEEVAFIQELSRIRVPIISSQPPLSFIENKINSGYLNDLFNLVSKKLGLEIEFIYGLSYIETLDAIKNKRVDLLNDYSSYGGQRDYILETNPVHISPFVAVGRNTVENINNINDLVNKRIVLVRGYQQTRSIQDRHPNLDIILVNSINEAYQALRSNNADIYIDNATHSGFYLNHYLISDLTIKGEFTEHELGQLSLHFAVRSDYPLLHSSVQKVLKSLTEKDYEKLRSKWLPSNQLKTTFELTNAEKTWLKHHKNIRVLLDPGWAPIEYLDSDGQFNGISINYLNKLESLLGISFELPNDLTWAEGIELFKNKKLDIAVSVAKTEEREKYSIFTEPYISMPIGIYARENVSYIGNMTSLEGKKVAVTKGYAVTDWIKRDYPQLNLKLVDTPYDGLQLVSNGDVDVFIGNIVTTTYYIGKFNFDDIHQAGETPYKNAQRMAVRDDWPELKTILQKAINSIPEIEKQQIYNKWMGLQFERTVDYRLVWIVVIIATSILFVVFYWNRKLQEAKKLAEIANEEKSRFLSNMSHELRTPMHAILSFSNLGLKKSCDEKALGYFDKIHISGQRLTKLLDDLLDLSKLEAGKMLPDFKINDMKTLITDCIESVESLTKDNRVKILFLCKSEILASFDKKLISQVIINLLSNAIKFSPQNSQINIQLEKANKSSKEKIIFSITDEGIGIPKDELEDVFNSFVQSTKTRTNTGGTGLGLPISKEIIELHHGKIWAESPPKGKIKGTEFIFQIPVKSTSETA